MFRSMRVFVVICIYPAASLTLDPSASVTLQPKGAVGVAGSGALRAADKIGADKASNGFHYPTITGTAGEPRNFKAGGVSFSAGEPRITSTADEPRNFFRANGASISVDEPRITSTADERRNFFKAEGAGGSGVAGAVDILATGLHLRSATKTVDDSVNVGKAILILWMVLSHARELGAHSIPRGSSPFLDIVTDHAGHLIANGLYLAYGYAMCRMISSTKKTLAAKMHTIGSSTSKIWLIFVLINAFHSEVPITPGLVLKYCLLRDAAGWTEFLITYMLMGISCIPFALLIHMGPPLSHRSIVLKDVCLIILGFGAPLLAACFPQECPRGCPYIALVYPVKGSIRFPMLPYMFNFMAGAVFACITGSEWFGCNSTIVEWFPNEKVVPKDMALLLISAISYVIYWFARAPHYTQRFPPSPGFLLTSLPGEIFIFSLSILLSRLRTVLISHRWMFVDILHNFLLTIGDNALMVFFLSILIQKVRYLEVNTESGFWTLAALEYATIMVMLVIVRGFRRAALEPAAADPKDDTSKLAGGSENPK